MPSGKAEWKKHWSVVLAAAAGTSLGSITTYALGLFVNPLEEQFGWSRAGISSALTIYAVVGMIGAPIAGLLLDRIGARRMGISAAAAFCGVVASLSLISHDIRTWWAIWFVLGLIGLGLKPAVWSKAVASFFFRSRGMALGAMLCGAGLSSSVLPLLSNMLVEQFGWRRAFVGLALVFAATVLPVLTLFLYDSNDRGTRDLEPPIWQQVKGWSASEGLRKRQVYQIALAAFIVTAVLVGFVVHIIPMLISLGLERSTTVKLVSVVGVLAVGSRLALGYLFDKVEHPAIGAISMAAPLLPAAILLFGSNDVVTAACAVVVLGLCIGGEYDAVIYLSTRYFGLRAFGTLFGVVETGLLAGVGAGPLIAGLIFDLTKSYQLFLLGVIPACLIAGFQLLSLGRYPDHGGSRVINSE